jgi:glycosyltransferase involved in cell wall biosynthesis
MKRVLIVAYYFPPLGGIGSLRTASFAHHLEQYGWRATVLAPANGAYLRDETLSTDVDVIRTRSIELSRAGKQLLRAGGTDVHAAQVAGPRAALKGLARRYLYFPDGQVGWMPPALLEARRKIGLNEFDAIFSSSFPVTAHLIARRLHRRLGIPWVAEYRDPWSAMLPAGSPTLARAQRLEGAIADEASALVTVSPSWARMFEQAWGDTVHVIRNGHDGGAPIATESEDPRFTLAYLGTYYPDTQDLSALWKAVAQLNTHDRYVDAIRLIGTSSPAQLDELGVAGIADLAEPTGFLAHDEALNELARASVLIVAGPRDSRAVLKGHVVAKLSEYLATDRPIIYVGNLDTDAAALLATYPGTHLVDADDVQAATEAILSARSDSFVRDASGLSRRVLAGQLADLLTAVSQ